MKRLDIVANVEAPHQLRAGAAFQKGLARHGIAGRIVHASHQVDCDVVACWGWRNGAMLSRGRRVLVMERGYIGDRFAWTSLGWDGLNGKARFGLRDDGGARLRQHFPDAVQYRAGQPKGDRYGLIMGQVAGDASISGIRIEAFYRRAADRVRELGCAPLFRQHPDTVRRRGAAQEVEGIPCLAGSLADALAGAAFVVSYNSNSLTDAALAGIPCIAGDSGAMAWPVVGQGLESRPVLTGVPRWAGRLAWCQWSEAEIESGAAWELVRSAMEPASVQGVAA